MARPRTVSDARLLHAARECLREEGPSVSLARIGERAGLSAAAVLRRFGSKEQLLFAALRPPGEPEFLRVLAAGPTTDDPARELARILTTVCSSFEVVAPALAAVRVSGLDVQRLFPPDRPGPAQQTRDGVRAWLARWDDDGVARIVDPEAAADLLVGACEARGFFGWVGAALDPVDDLEGWCLRLVRSVLGGAGQGGEPGPS